MRCTALILLLVALIHFSVAQTPTPKAWPTAWNATVTITLSDIIIGAPADVYYDANRQMQVVYFSQCAMAGGVVNYQPCVNVQSSQPDNHGVRCACSSFIPLSPI